MTNFSLSKPTTWTNMSFSRAAARNRGLKLGVSERLVLRQAPLKVAAAAVGATLRGRATRVCSLGSQSLLNSFASVKLGQTLRSSTDVSFGNKQRACLFLSFLCYSSFQTTPGLRERGNGFDGVRVEVTVSWHDRAAFSGNLAQNRPCLQSVDEHQPVASAAAAAAYT